MHRTWLVALLWLVAARPVLAGEGAVADYLDRCAAFGFSGSVLVVRDGAVVVDRGYGTADREAGIANTPDTVFEIASATKPFTACAVLRLVELGKVGLDDPIAKHLPGVPADKRGITVRHLLAHTSGMPRRAAGGHGPDLEAAVAAYLAMPLAREPGAAHEYWNGGYALLAGIVERASGMDYTAFCREHLFAPAGLESTGFTGDDLARQAVGYEDGTPRRAAEHPYRSYGWQYRGMGGIVTSTRDLARFLEAYEAGRILRGETVALMERAASEHYGLGWGVTRTKRGTRRIGHGGDVRGFHCQIQRFPDENATVIVLCNVALPTWTIAWNLEALLLGGTPPYPMPPPLASLSGEDLARLEGAYALDDGNAFGVRRAGRGLSLSARGLRACGLLSAGAVPGDAAAQVRKAETLFGAVQRGDPEPVAEALMSHIPKSWPQWLVTRIWPSHVEKWGPLRRASVAGARAAGPGGVAVFFELEHENGTACLKIVLQRGRLSIFDLEARRRDATMLFLPVSRERFVAFDWMRGEGASVRFEDGGVLRIGEARAERASPEDEK